ncbi:LysM domain protein [Pseudodesulfovibrio profundus]|uniref:LysM domain protein n=2 Tax=Pseudodesulfovibrio profundus TaxID=57320 RepID=A0A2C8FAH2_9BACT|nr:LysM domain protein [Pseudodesulfovibrio profundus]
MPIIRCRALVPMRMKRLWGIPFLAGFFLLAWAGLGLAASHETSHPMESSQFPSLESAIRLKGPIYFCGERVPIDNPDIRERLEKELLLMLWDRAQVILWLKRTGRYFPHIETVLRGAGMPDDLKYIAVIESALKPLAGSSRGARGIWQFIPSTGRNYGLTVDRYTDERRNFHLATKAAVAYFTDLHDMFGSWSMACAAYNMGEKGLERRVEQQEVDEYYKLDLPTETERYVLRAVAAKLILADPSRYGFKMMPEDYYQPRRFDRVRLKHTLPTPVSVVAKAAGSYYKQICDLNPQLLRGVVPPGDTVIFLPEDSAKRFARNYQQLVDEYRAKNRTKTYVVCRGDTLTSIASRNNLPLWKLLKMNDLKYRSVIQPGQELVVSQ